MQRRGVKHVCKQASKQANERTHFQASKLSIEFSVWFRAQTLWFPATNEHKPNNQTKLVVSMLCFKVLGTNFHIQPVLPVL